MNILSKIELTSQEKPKLLTSNLPLGYLHKSKFSTCQRLMQAVQLTGLKHPPKSTSFCLRWLWKRHVGGPTNSTDPQPKQLSGKVDPRKFRIPTTER